MQNRMPARMGQSLPFGPCFFRDSITALWDRPACSETLKYSSASAGSDRKEFSMAVTRAYRAWWQEPGEERDAESWGKKREKKWKEVFRYET